MLRRKDTLGDRIWRMRGVVAVVTIPLVVIAIFVLFVPSSDSSAFTSLTSTPAAAGPAFAVVFDAGSTGSRVHVFEFARESAGGALALKKDTFEQLKPGLSDAGWAADAQASAASLQPLLDVALATVPAELQRGTPVEVRATAGLRKLPGTQADAILDAVRGLLLKTPFRLAADGVSIMGGDDEGAFAWMTINYLLGNTGKAAEKLVGAVDLGGGSVQAAFAVDGATARGAPPGYIQQLSGGGETYNVYVHSYLGFGLMEARAAVLAAAGSSRCFSAGVSGSYTAPSGGDAFPLEADAAGGNSEACIGIMADALQIGAPCEQATMCSFAGAWGGAKSQRGRTFYVMSYFFDRAKDAGIIAGDHVSMQPVVPGAFKAAAQRACSTPFKKLTNVFPGLSAEDAPFLCLDLSLQYAILTQGLMIPGDEKVTLVKQLEYKGDKYEAAWPLGAAINTLSS